MKKAFEVTHLLVYVVFVLVALAVILKILCMLDPDLASPTIAAWVQAVGSIGAIGSAVWVLNRQHDAAIARDEDEIRQVLYSLRDEIAVIRTSPLWSQEAAGRAQAFGTIAAIVGTWFVARHQQEHGQRVLQAEVLSADKKKAEACFEVAKDACVVLDNVAAQFREHANGAKLSVGSERIEDVQFSLRTLS